MDSKRCSNKNLSSQLAANTLLDEAFHYICQSKKQAHVNHDIWFIRRDWQTLRSQLQANLLSGNYLLSPAKRIKIAGHSIAVWNSLDAIVLKALSLLLGRTIYPALNIYKHCYHTKGKGLKAAIKVMNQLTTNYTFVYKTDIKNYYASLDRHKIQESLGRWIKDNRILSLLWQYCDRIEELNGHCISENRGLPKGGALSVLIGKLYLVDLDQLSEQHGTKYLRYTDDIIIFCKTRWILRKMVKNVRSFLAKLQRTVAKSKTYIGKTTKSYDFLGDCIAGDNASNATTVSQTSIQRFYQRLQRLYEQRAAAVRVAAYKKCWYQWITGGLDSIRVKIPAGVYYSIGNPDDLMCTAKYPCRRIVRCIR